MTISNFVAYVKQAWKNKPDTSTPLSAARLTHLEDGIKGNSDAIEKIAAAVVSQIVNDPNKIASMASLYSVNQAVTQLNSDFAKVATIVRATTPNITVADNDVIMSITLYDGTWLVSAYAGGNKVLIQDNATPHLSYRHGTNPVDFVIASSELNYQLVNKSGGNIQTYGDGSNFYLIAIRIK